MDLTQYDMDELRMAAQKRMARPGESPHARKLIALDADKLLWLLEAAKDAQALRRADHQRVEDEKECCCVRTPPYDGCDVHS